MTRPARIYVVDDDLHILVAFRRLLEAAKYDVATYNSPMNSLPAMIPLFQAVCCLTSARPNLAGWRRRKDWQQSGTRAR